MTHSLYLRYEVLRAFRNRIFLVFSLGFPLVLFLVVAGTNRHAVLDGISFPLYYMTGMTAWGAMAAVVSSGARIAAERQAGWIRQMRITPLPTRTYFSAKVVSGYLLAGLSMVVLYAVGSAMGIRLSASQWLTMTGLLLAGLVPFAVLGIVLGHLLTADSVGPAMGGITAVFALLGGTWFPLATGGVLLRVVKIVPSYWLVQAGKTALGGHGWPAEGWLVVAVWTVALGLLAARVYRRDTARV
jgi:ABC-2 type transport system permease protein